MPKKKRSSRVPQLTPPLTEEQCYESAGLFRRIGKESRASMFRRIRPMSDGAVLRAERMWRLADDYTCEVVKLETMRRRLYSGGRAPVRVLDHVLSRLCTAIRQGNCYIEENALGKEEFDKIRAEAKWLDALEASAATDLPEMRSMFRSRL